MTKHHQIIDFDETLENISALMFFNILTEGKLEDAKASLSEIPQSQTEFDAFSKSPQIQKYIDSGLFKPAFWLTVAKWFKNDRFLAAHDVVNAISEMFDDKMNDIIKSFTSITTFNDFTNRIHAYGEESKRDIASSDYFKNDQTKNYTRTNTVPNGGIIPSPDDIVYNDSNIMIIRAEDVTKAQRYGNGYGWCIAARGSNNLFFNYTLANDGGEFFYILKKHADYSPVNSAESSVYKRIDFADRTHYSAVMYDGQTYSLTLANNGYVNGGDGPYDGNTMNNVEPEKIISLLSNGDQAVKTSLKTGLRAMQQAWKGMSPERQEFLSKLKNTELTDEEFNKLSGSDKYTYINLGHTLTDGQLAILRKSKAWGDAARIYLRATMVTGNIPYSQFTSITKLTNDDLAEAGSNPNFTAPNGIASSYIRELKDISTEMIESKTRRPSYIWIYENPQLWKDYVKSQNTKVQHETLQTQTEQLLEDIAFEIFIGKPRF